MKKIIFFSFKILFTVAIEVAILYMILSFTYNSFVAPSGTITVDVFNVFLTCVDFLVIGAFAKIFLYFWGKRIELQEDDVLFILCDVADEKAIPHFACESFRKLNETSYNSYPQDSSVLSPNKAYLRLILKGNAYDNLEAYLIFKIKLELIPRNFVYTYKPAFLVEQGRDDILNLGSSRFYKPNKKADAAHIEAFLYLFHNMAIARGESLDTKNIFGNKKVDELQISISGIALNNQGRPVYKNLTKRAKKAYSSTGEISWVSV